MKFLSRLLRGSPSSVRGRRIREQRKVTDRRLAIERLDERELLTIALYGGSPPHDLYIDTTGGTFAAGAKNITVSMSPGTSGLQVWAVDYDGHHWTRSVGNAGGYTVYVRLAAGAAGPFKVNLKGAVNHSPPTGTGTMRAVINASGTTGGGEFTGATVNATNFIWGTSGVDKIDAGGTSDWIFGDAGGDIIHDYGNSAVVFGGADNDTIATFNTVSDMVWGQGGVDDIKLNGAASVTCNGGAEGDDIRANATCVGGGTIRGGAYASGDTRGDDVNTSAASGGWTIITANDSFGTPTPDGDAVGYDSSDTRYTFMRGLVNFTGPYTVTSPWDHVSASNSSADSIYFDATPSGSFNTTIGTVPADAPDTPIPDQPDPSFPFPGVPSGLPSPLTDTPPNMTSQVHQGGEDGSVDDPVHPQVAGSDGVYLECMSSAGERNADGSVTMHLTLNRQLTGNPTAILQYNGVNQTPSLPLDPTTPVTDAEGNYTYTILAPNVGAGDYTLHLNWTITAVTDATLSPMPSWFWTTTDFTANLNHQFTSGMYGADDNVTFLLNHVAANDLTLAEFSLTRDGVPVDLTTGDYNTCGPATLQYDGFGSYTLDLMSHAATAGNYTLTLHSVPGGVVDANGNSLQHDYSVSWTTTLSATMQQSTDWNGNDVVTMDLDRPAVLARSDFRLLQGSTDVPLVNASFGPDSNNRHYAFYFYGLTHDLGSYQLSLTASTLGVPVAAGSDVTWSHVATLTASISISTDYSGGDTAWVSFSDYVWNSNAGMFNLTRDGQPVSLSSQYLMGSGNSGYLDLWSATRTPGTYVLTLPKDAVSDSHGYPMAADASVTWTHASPLTASLSAYTDWMTNHQMVSVSFSRDVSSWYGSGLTLTCNGNAVSTSFSSNGWGTSYTIDVSSASGPTGNYILTFSGEGTGVYDTYGNPLVGTSSTGWYQAPLTGNLSGYTDWYTNNDTVSISFSRDVSCGPSSSSFSLTRDGAGVSLSGAYVTGGGSSYTLDLAYVTKAPGYYVLTMAGASSGVTDFSGNPLSNNSSVSWSKSSPLTASLWEYTDWNNNDVVSIYFSRDVYSYLSTSNFKLYCNGSEMAMYSAYLSGYGSSYTLDLSNVTNLSGSNNYNLVLLGGFGVTDSYGNPLNADVSVYWYKYV